MYEDIKKITPVNKQYREQARQRLNSLTKPLGSLGILEDIAERVCAIRENLSPKITNKTVFVFAADHGIAEERVSAYPKEVTAQMVYNFINGGACINALARFIQANLVVVDMGVAESIQNEKVVNKKIGYGTKNFLKEPAMTKAEAEKSILAGMEVVKEYGNESDLICVGDMGIANTTASSAIISCVTGESPEKVTGRGTMVDDATLKRKIQMIDDAIKCREPKKNDAIDILSKIGGFEIGGIAGAILQTGAMKKIIMVDGLITTAGLLLAYLLNPNILDYVFAGHNSLEGGHRVALNFLGLKPLIDLNLRLGEGSGAALSVPIIEAAVKILNEMATFDQAGVSEKNGSH